MPHPLTPGTPLVRFGSEGCPTRLARKANPEGRQAGGVPVRR